MDMQEPEEQRLEEELMEPAEDLNLPSDEPVLSDADASTTDEEPASDIQPSDETEADSAEEVVEEESTTDAPVADGWSLASDRYRVLL